jgi:membrane-associated protein
MLDFLKTLLDSKEIINTGGLFLIVLIVYVENGLFFGFFLPGDYLLFLAGVFCGTQAFAVSIVALVLAVTAASVAGSFTGYYFGNVLGKNLLHKKDSLFFKFEYLVRTRVYFMKFGGKTLIVSRFLPIVRTFAPILAGMVKMEIKKFTFFNVLGGVIWVFSLILSGYFLGTRFPQIMHYLEYVVFFFLAITSFVVVKGFFEMNKKKKQKMNHLKSTI